MALVNISSLLADTLRALDKIDPPGGVELLSYKRNRGIAIIKKDGGGIELREQGYKEQEIDIPLPQLPKVLKAMLKREFPRSRKVRLIKFDDPKVLDRVRQKI